MYTNKRHLIFTCILMLGLLSIALPGQVSNPAVASAQAQSENLTQGSMPHTITVVGEGRANGEPDIAVATIGIQIRDDNVQAASSEAQQTMQSVLDALQSEGIDEADLQTSGFSIFAESGPGMEGEGLGSPAYRVTNNVNVIIRELTKVGAILDAAIMAGANNIFGVQFSIEDASALASAARTDAIDNAEAKAHELAQLTGLQLGNIVSVSEIIGSQGGFYNSASVVMQDSIGRGGGGPIVAGNLTVNVQLEVVYAAVPAGSVQSPDLPPVRQEDMVQGEQDSDSEVPEENISLAQVDSVEIMMGDATPISAVIRGNLSDSCMELAQSSVTRNENTFEVVLQVRHPTAEMCAQVMMPYEETVSLGVEPSELAPDAEYIVVVNGQVTKSFEVGS